MTESNQLLREYAERGSEAAFRELVGRYVDFVYSVALRRVNGDTQLAEEIVQTVFTDLARQARQAKVPVAEGPCALGGWLHRHTGFVASNVRRAEQRRQNRERTAVEMNSLEQTGEPAWQQLAPVLDEVITELGPEDRDAILLRYYERRDLRAVGAALGVSEDAAQKRVSRGLEKLRTLLSARGIMFSLGALATILTEQAVTAAPAYLSLLAAETALGAGAATVGTAGTGGLAAILFAIKAKILIAAMAVGLVSVPLVLWYHQQASRPTTVNSTTAVTGRFARPQTARAGTVPDTATNPVRERETGPAVTASFEGLRLTILAADTGKPVPNATIDYWCWAGQLTRKKVQGTQAGIAEIPFPPAATTELKLTTQIDGFADTCLHWQPDHGEQIPLGYTLRLTRPTPIGGQVVDTDGQPVANAKVGWNHEENPKEETRPESHQFSWIEVETDADGRWSINRIAEDMIPRLYGSAGHPEHARSKLVFVGREPGADQQLRAGTHVFQLGRALLVRGIVIDPTDQPVRGAKVLVGHRGESGRREGTTGVDGAFTIAGCKLGENLITAEAKGFAPTTLKVEIAENSEPFRIRLGPGKTLRLRVVDKAGQPVAGANVWYDTFGHWWARQGTNGPVPVQVDFGPKTDEQGRAVWEDAPDQELTFDFHKSGYMRMSDVLVRPDGREHEVILPPALTISGSVTDASTGKPIPRCRLICGWPEHSPFENTTRAQWSTLERFWVNFEGGTFHHSLEEAVIGSMSNPGYVFKFEAEGYAPSITGTIAPYEGEVRLDIKLEAASATTITVLLPDGRPAARAEVGLLTPGAFLRLLPGGFSRDSGVYATAVISADSSGQVRLPPDQAIQKIVAVHPQGYVEAAPVRLQAEPRLQLQPWGRIEGTYWSRGQPVAGRELILEFVNTDLRMLSFDFEAYRTTTDAQGRFTFTKAPPVELKLSRVVPEPQPDGRKSWSQQPLTTVEVKPGETTQVELGKTERPVVMRLRWPDGWQRQPGWLTWASIGTPLPIVPAEIRANPPALALWWNQPENQALLTNVRTFPLRESGSGSWTAEEVPPGNYIVRVYVRDTNAPAGADNLHGHFEIPVVVPDDSSINSFDLGELLLQPAAE